MAFSGALTITDLDDFLNPSQACILPVRQTNKQKKQASGENNLETEIHIDDKNNYYEVAMTSKPGTAANPPSWVPASSTAVSGSAGAGEEQPLQVEVQVEGQSNGTENKQGGGKQLEKAEISLNDCLACR